MVDARKFHESFVGNLFCLLLILEAAQTNLIQNGDFEDPIVPNPSWFLSFSEGSNVISGWRVVGHSIELNGPLYYNSGLNNSQSVDLCGSEGGGVFQTFPSVVGNKHLLSFWLRGNPAMVSGDLNCQQIPANNEFKVFVQVDNFNILDVAIDYRSGWRLYQYQYVSKATESILTIFTFETGRCGPYLDKVSVTPIDCIFDLGL